ncbi:MAG: HAD family hydrolase [Actinomycetota bacterium]
MSVVEAVLLDAGGVLLLPDSSVIVGELADAGVVLDPALLERAHYAGIRATDLDASDEMSWWPYNHAYVDALDVAETKVDAARAAVNRAFAAMEWNVVIEGALAAIATLHELVRHVAIVSNSDGSVERLLRSLGVIGSSIETVIDSHITGVAKPDPAIFELALRSLGVEASRALHVGDSVRFDVVGARAAGVRPLHLDPYGLCPDADHEHIEALADVARIV